MTLIERLSAEHLKNPNKHLERPRNADFEAMLRENSDTETRAIYADWCEDNGNMELAELLRSQK